MPLKASVTFTLSKRGKSTDKKRGQRLWSANKRKENRMPVQLENKNGGKVLEVRVTGKLAHEDYARFVPDFDRFVEEDQSD